MAKIEWNKKNTQSFTKALNDFKAAAEDPEVTRRVDWVLGCLEFGDTNRIVDNAEKTLEGFKWSPARYSSETLEYQVSEMELLIQSCFDVSGYDNADAKGKRLLTTNTKTTKDGTKAKPVPLTGAQIQDILLKRLHRAAKAEDTK